jgi:hypothetical protein
MGKRLYAADIEGDGLLDTVTKVWCATFTEFSPNMKVLGTVTYTKLEDIVAMFTNPDNILAMHNGQGYDGPAIAKVAKVKVQAKIICTLHLSWYMYPRMIKHGLATWGEELGIAKPEVDDWENLSLEEYVHRCEEDVKIQTALWLQMWKHLMLLYSNDPKAVWHCIDHVNLKARIAALKERSKWKIDVERTEEAQEMFQSKYDEAKEALDVNMPQVPVYATRSFPKKPFLVNGKLSAIGLRWEELVKKEVDEKHWPLTGVLDYRQDIKVVTGYKDPNAGSSQQIKAWLTSMGWEPESFKYVRDKVTKETRIIPQIKNQETGELCESIVRLIPKEPSLKYLEEMSIVKHRLTVVKGFLRHVDEDGFVVAAIQGLTNTLRFKHKVCVNIPSVRKPYGELIRGLLIAKSEKTELCGSDMSSLEDRTKQHYMFKHDPEYVKEMQEEGFDPHLDMSLAANMISQEQIDWFKAYDKEAASHEDHDTHAALALVRHAGKGTNYAATYGATGPTIARSAGVAPEVGDTLHAAYWDRNWSLTAIADECVVKTSRGHKWLWNPVAKMWFWLKAEKDRFSTLNQSTGTYAFDRWVFYILEQREQLTADFHDEVVLELKVGNREAMTKILSIAMDKTNEELDLNRELDFDVDFGRSYAEIH